MKVEIAFSGESRRRPRIRYNLHRVAPGMAVQFVVTCSRPTIVSYHWHNKAPVIHTVPLCICSSLLLPSRERGYLGGLLGRYGPDGHPVWEPGVLELTQDGLDACQLLAGERSGIRGARIRCKRRDARKGSQLQIELAAWEPLERLPIPLDVLGFVGGLWEPYLPQIALPRTAGADHRVPWDDPGSEIPCA